MIHNHYGYGLRNDEKPYAHKIPPGGNWRSLPVEEQKAFMKGSYGNGGGNSYQLRRMSWDEAAATITTAPMGKATCQLHPGAKTWEDDGLVANHVASTMKIYDSDDDKTKRHTNRPTYWNEPSPTIVFGGGNGGARPHPHPNTPFDGGSIMRKPLLDSLEALPLNGLTAVSLFSGGGLMDIGIIHAGIRVIWANDFEKNPCIAYRHNIGDHIVLGDITQIPIESIPDSDLIIGGPPCQDYSVAGTGAGEEGERGILVWRYLAIIEAKQPKAFLFENVKGLITKKHRPTLDKLLQTFDEIGYNVSWRVVNAWDYGVAQKRERVIIAGVRKDLAFSFEFPAGNDDHPVLRDAIGDLPAPVDHVGANVKKAERAVNLDKPGPSITTQFRCQTVEITNHIDHLFDNVGNNPTWEHANRVAPWDQPAPTRTEKDRCDGIHPGPLNHRNIKDERTNRNESSTYNGAKLKYAIQPLDEPCNTVTEKARGGDYLCHPNPRRFTVRECLRIQSVPDSYIFPDTLSLSAMYKIVGNGVASRVAYYLGQALSAQLIAALEVQQGYLQAAVAKE